MTIKGNQPQLLQETQGLFARLKTATATTANPFRPAQVVAVGHWCSRRVARHQSVSGGHGRIEVRTLCCVEVPASFGEHFPGVRQVWHLERRVTHKKSGHVSCESVVGVTSLAPAVADAKSLHEVVRAHWGIENKSHWIRDVLWREDHNRARTSAVPQVLAALRNLALPLLRRIHPTNMARATRMCAANPQRAVNLLLKTE